jgi:hypothetical protein
MILFLGWMTASHKCNFTIFSRSKKHTKKIDKSLNVTINGQKISFEKNPKFLGIKFDGYLNGSEHIDEIKEKTKNRLNILRILSFKKRWMINVNVLINIYKSLIRSIIDYSAFLVSFASDSQLERLERIQNEALRIIFKVKKSDHIEQQASKKSKHRTHQRKTNLPLKKLHQTSDLSLKWSH